MMPLVREQDRVDSWCLPSEGGKGKLCWLTLGLIFKKISLKILRRDTKHTAGFQFIYQIVYKFFIINYDK